MTLDDAMLRAALLRAQELDVQGRCGYSHAEQSVLELATEVMRLRIENDRLRRDRAEALNVRSKEGLLASEWVGRTGRAEAKLARVEALPAELRGLAENSTLKATEDSGAETMLKFAADRIEQATKGGS